MCSDCPFFNSPPLTDKHRKVRMTTERQTAYLAAANLFRVFQCVTVFIRGFSCCRRTRAAVQNYFFPNGPSRGG